MQGFATDAGSRTYHTAILARSLNVPAIVGLHDASLRIAAGTPVVLDGTTGELVVAPPPEQIDDAQRRASRPRRRGAAAAEAGPVVDDRWRARSGSKPTSSCSKTSST